MSDQPVIDDNYILPRPSQQSSLRSSVTQNQDDKSLLNDFEILNKESFASDRKLLQEQMKKLLQKSEVISIEEKGYLIQMMHNKSMRPVMTEILAEITSPKPLKNLESLKLFADIIKFILTCKFSILIL